MESVADNAPLIVIVGPTASGKSALAMRLAQYFNGEIISADSRTVYRGMDIGTAKPSLQDQELVRHHLLDIVDPDQAFTVADFQQLAKQAITDVAARGKVPFLVGGTGLYVDAVLYNFRFRSVADPALRQELASLSVPELQARLFRQGIALPANAQNPRHLVRALETPGETPQKSSLRPHTLVLGLEVEKSVLAQRIEQRIHAMLAAGFEDEVRRLQATYDFDLPTLQAPGYQEFRAHLAGDVSLAAATQQFVRKHLQYAKRQKTWFRRNKDISWICNFDESVALITTFLNK